MNSNSVDLTNISRPGSSTETPEVVRPAFATGWRRQAQRLYREARVAYFVFKNPRTPWYAKLIAACTAGYLFSPIQLIPSYIPVIGFLDDVLVLFFGVRLLRRITPADVLTESRELADAAKPGGKDEIRSTATVVASVAIAAVWLLAAIAASALIAAYIFH